MNRDFIDALPIAAGVFTIRHGRLWVDVVNRKFHDLAECGVSEDFAEKFRKHAEGDGGAFIRNLLADPADAPDERQLCDGEGAIGRASRLSSRLFRPATMARRASLAEALGMSTTAEGIETVELATTLVALGCSSGQGFYFAEPLVAGEAVDFWRKRALSAR